MELECTLITVHKVTGANNIFYGNTTDETFDPETAFTYNAIQAASTSGTGNIALASGSQATLFTAPTATTGIIEDPSSNWLPIAGSGLFNVGLNSAAVGTTDIAGNDRIQLTTIDLGAYETSLSTAVENIKSNESTVFAKQGGGVIENANAYSIFSIEGRLVKSGLLNSNLIPLAKGAYIVKAIVGNKTEIAKVIVR